MELRTSIWWHIRQGKLKCCLPVPENNYTQQDTCHLSDNSIEFSWTTTAASKLRGWIGPCDCINSRKLIHWRQEVAILFLPAPKSSVLIWEVWEIHSASKKKHPLLIQLYLQSHISSASHPPTYTFQPVTEDLVQDRQPESQSKANKSHLRPI